MSSRYVHQQPTFAHADSDSLAEFLNWRSALAQHKRFHGDNLQNFYVFSRTISDAALKRSKLPWFKQFNPFLVTDKERPPPNEELRGRGLQHIIMEPYDLASFSRKNLPTPTLFEFGPTVFNALVDKGNVPFQMLVLVVRHSPEKVDTSTGALCSLAKIFTNFTLIHMSQPFEARNAQFYIYVFRKMTRSLDDIQHLFK